MKKRIGLVAWATGTNSFGATIPYVAFFSKFGVVELIMPNEKEIRDLDLLVLPGGPDVDTKRYLAEGEELSLFIGKPCPFKERFDKELLPKYISNGTPIFAICRGLQSLAVEFGGRLVQDMYEVGLPNAANPEHDREKLIHNIKINHDVANLIPGLPKTNFEVNSIHHQCVEDSILPADGKVLARYTNKTGVANGGHIEAMTWYPEFPIHGVQWHPEEIKDEFSLHLINHLLEL